MRTIIDLFSRPAISMLNNVANPPVSYVGNSGLMYGPTSTNGTAFDKAYRAYGSVGTLFAIVNQIGNQFARVRWGLYRKGTRRDSPRRKEVTDHSFLTVWNKPNPFYTGRLFRETVQQHLDLVGVGAFVLYKVGGLVLEMWPVRPDRLFPVKHPTKFMTGYIYKGPDNEEVPLALDQVVRLIYPDPRDPYWGIGPVQSILADIDAAQYSAEWNRNFFINGAKPGGVIEVDYRMSDTEFKSFLNRWRQQHQGVANAHRVAVLENAKWVDTNFSMTDMQFVELRNLSRELIREAFAYPKPMLGSVDDVNRANADAGKEIMAEGQTLPRLERWHDVINFDLLQQFANGKNLEADFDDPTPINAEAANKERNSKAKAAKDLVDAGYHHEDVAEAVGLPEMRFSKPKPPPAVAPAPPAQEGDEEDESTNMLVRR